MVKVFRTPVRGGGGGGPYGPNIRNILFRTNFSLKLFWVTGKVLKKQQQQQQPKRSKKIENQTKGFKMAANKPFEILRHQLSSQKCETIFPKEF